MSLAAASARASPSISFQQTAAVLNISLITVTSAIDFPVSTPVT